jgi:glycosyltransferase involved in cell wall biosynthesis
MEVSVIVAMKNTKKYLCKCIDSIMNQSYKNFNIIIVDDMSKEFSEDIVSLYNSDKIKYIYSKTPVGCGGAREIGRQNSNSKYICFVDSDDWIDLNYLESAVEIMKNEDAEIGILGLKREYDITPEQPIFKCFYDKVYSFNGVTAFKIMTFQYDFGIKIPPPAINKIYLREFLDNNNINFQFNINFEDIPFNVEAILKSQKIVTIPNALYHHYKRSGSIIQSITTKNIDDMHRAFSLVKKYLSKNFPEFSRKNFYSFFEHFFNLIIRQIFQFAQSEEEKKHYIKYALDTFKDIIDINDYIDYCSAEKLRRHIQPHIKDTTIN